jgi:ankyrin repeat protein
MVNDFKKNKKSSFNFFFPLGRTPLHHAAMRNNYNNAKQLIQLGAPIDVKIF